MNIKDVVEYTQRPADLNESKLWIPLWICSLIQKLEMYLLFCF